MVECYLHSSYRLYINFPIYTGPTFVFETFDCVLCVFLYIFCGVQLQPKHPLRSWNQKSKVSWNVSSMFVYFQWILLQLIYSMCLFTCAGVGRVEGQGRVASETRATSLAPAADSVVSALVANAPGGPAGGEPRPPREVTAVGVAVALAFCTHTSGRVMRKLPKTFSVGKDEVKHMISSLVATSWLRLEPPPKCDPPSKRGLCLNSESECLFVTTLT